MDGYPDTGGIESIDDALLSISAIMTSLNSGSLLKISLIVSHLGLRFSQYPHPFIVYTIITALCLGILL